VHRGAGPGSAARLSKSASAVGRSDIHEFTCANLWLSLVDTNSENDTDEGAELKPRAGSAAASLGAFYDHPVMGTAEIEASAGSAFSQVYRAIDQLVNAGFIEEITGRKRDRVWAASEVMAELDDLDRRIQAAMYEGKQDG